MCFPLFGQNTGKYGPEKTPHLGTFQTVHTIEYFNKDKDNSRIIM